MRGTDSTVTPQLDWEHVANRKVSWWDTKNGVRKSGGFFCTSLFKVSESVVLCPQLKADKH